ncbi:MAG: hypothetical protein ACLUE7_01030 [Lachnospirales bacterium]
MKNLIVACFQKNHNILNGVSQYDRILEISDTCREGIAGMERTPFYALFMGGVGLGKTFLCSCLAKFAMEMGYECCVCNSI